MAKYHLEQLHDDIVYIIECLAETLTGEAKHALFLLLEEFPVNQEIPDGLELRDRVSAIREDLVVCRRTLPDVAASLSAIRRDLANRIARTQGRRLPYNLQ